MGKVVSSLFGGGGGDNGAKQAAEAQAQASEAQARAERSRQEAEAAAANMKANFATDLKQENIGTVVAGGTADVAASTASDLLKKKKGIGLSSQLGLNA